MKNNKFHGKGRFTYSSGMYYEGDWVNGYEHGQGTLEKSVIKYSGTWQNGEMCGEGILI